MGKITAEELQENLEFKCARCSAECTKTDSLEPTLGYISKVDGSIVAPLCQACYNMIPPNERQSQKYLEAAFLVVIRPDGEGYSILREGIEIPYLRDATVVEIKSACQDIIDDLNASKLLMRFTQLTSQIKQQVPVGGVPLIQKRR
jgi:hypothetical protein